MKADFGMDDSAADKFNGYLTGMSEYVSKTDFTSSALEYVQSILKNRYESAVDLAARAQPQRFHHVYEWGDEYGDYSTVGLPQARLWKIEVTGKGKSRSLAYKLLPSVRPVPIEPELLEPGKTGKSVREGVHIFTWKAVVMEYGQTVHIAPKLRQVKAMAFVVDGKMIFRSRPVTTVPGKDNRNAGAFTGFTYTWWGVEAPAIYSSEIKPMLEKQLVPRINGRFASWNKNVRAKRAVLSGLNAGLNADFQAGRRAGIADMKAQAIDYVARAQKRRDDLYGD